jgi:hypothetical protein
VKFTAVAVILYHGVVWPEGIASVCTEKLALPPELWIAVLPVVVSRVIHPDCDPSIHAINDM